MADQLIRGAGGPGAPSEAKDTLDSQGYLRVVDILGEGEIQGFSTPEKNGISKTSPAYLIEGYKDIYVENTPVLRSSAVIKSGTYTQTSTTITVNCTAHGYLTGKEVRLFPTSGLATVDNYKITSTTTNSFTCASKNNNVTSGSLAIATPGDFNFTKFEVAALYGTPTQTLPSGFNAVESEFSVNTKVEFDVPIVRTITNTDITAVRVTINIPALQRTQSDGDIVGTKLDLAIDISENGGGFVTAIQDTIKGRSRDLYQKDYEVSLIGRSFPIDVRVRRITADSTSSKLNNEFLWFSYTEVNYVRLTYPNTALIAGRFAAEQFSNIPTRSYRIRGRKVAIPSNATVELSSGRLIYAGTWDGTFQAAQWTTDPAWCLWNLLTDYRAGFGDHLDPAVLDKWAFYSSSQYTNELVKTGFKDNSGNDIYEPRFSCNVNIQTREEAYKLISDLASVFRVMPYWSAGALTVSADKPRDATFLFNLSNVSEAGFTYQSSSQKVRPNVAVVSYLDLNTRDLAFEQVEDADEIAKYGMVTTEVSAFACTSQSQANRIGRWILYSEKYESETISFTTSIDSGVIVRPGQVIAVSDPVRAGSRRGGRISSATTTVITVDDATGLTVASTPTLSVILPDGTTQTKSVSTIVGNNITVASAFTVAPNPNSIWIFETTTLQTSLWRVISLEEQDGSNYIVNALSYDPSKYDYIEAGEALEPRDTTDLTLIVDPPDSIIYTEALYLYQAQVRAKIILSWPSVTNVAEYKVRYRKDLGNWQSAITTAPDYEILDITPGDFDVEVYSLNSVEKPSTTAAKLSLTALGKTAPPSGVVNFNYTTDPNLGVLLTWDNVTDIDLDRYEIRRGTNWGTATLITQVKATTYKLGYMDNGTYTYLIKAIDSSGVYSTNAATIAVTIAGANLATISNTIEAGNLVLTWTVPTIATYAIDYYRITYGNVYASSTEIAKIKSTMMMVPINWIGSRTFWVVPIDMAGKFSNPPNSQVVTITGAAAPTITTAVGGNTATLTWTAVAGTVPTAGYEIRQGTTFATATVLANITGTSYTLKATWSGNQTFWVVARDINGNYGTQASAVITVNLASAPTLTSSFAGQNVVFTWAAIKGTLNTDYYLLKRGSTWATATEVATIYSTAYTLKANWGGSQTFMLAAVDINGNEGTPTSLAVTVTIPTAPTITQQVIDNNVLLRWNDVTQTLPILNYELRRGSTWATAAVIGTKQGGFTTIFETTAGTYTYWLAGIDSAGNYGTPGNVLAIINQPPDYVLQLDQNSTWAGDEINIYTDSVLGQIVNVNTTETWQSHFTSRGYTSPQDQVTAGYTYYLMPSTTTASYEEEIDYGALLAGTKVSALLTSTTIAGSTTSSPTIRVRGTTSTAATYSQTTTTITVTSTAHGLIAGDYVYLDFTTGTATDGTYVVATAVANSFTVTSATSTTTSGNVSWIKWRSYAGLSEVYETQFRYFRVRYDFTSSGNNDLLLLTTLNIRLDSKLRNDAGTGTANSADVGGTVVTFNVAFVDIQSISVTPLATSGIIAVYDFVDVPNPTSFKVLLFNTSGTRVSGSFSWSARGV